MVGVVVPTVLLALLPAWVASSGEGNIKLLENEVAIALKACTYPEETTASKDVSKERQRRSDDYDGSPRIDNNMKEGNRYSHERRNNDSGDQMMVLNATDYDYEGYGTGNMGEKLLTSVPRPASPNLHNNINNNNTSRTRRSEPLLNKPDSDQCLSQCVFANLQVVDSRGIPREAELWNKVQSAVTSQQSRSALHDQIRACFEELQSEAEDNGCSYSNKLERCLMLRFSDRQVDGKATTKKPASTEQS
ncbi:hypothetical protein PYW07_005878 [Mythimna separata]|uniref:Uncharacterized protein n=1 Tax=Mythimna separata TaxID=271217 RepID=A0AAD7YKR4_MYTSE|nr:hypothetical protein PYW07_005878 [Mythimna separata]